MFDTSRDQTTTSKKTLSSNVDISHDSARSPMLSPKFDHKDYNRMKYYSALRTGYAHLGIEEQNLEPPSHIIDKALFLF